MFIMKFALTTGTLVAAAITGATAQACAAGSAQEINGNWYCQAVNAITYTNFNGAGTYNKVTSMANGVCGSTPVNYGGAVAPMDEEVSWHFRGPLQLKQFAFYTLGTSPSKRKIRPSSHARRHGHQHFHARDNDIREINENHLVEEKRAVGDMVTATIDGQVVSWINQYAGTKPSSAVGEGGDALAGSKPVFSVAVSSAIAVSSVISVTPQQSASPSVNAGSGNWGRQAYYDAGNQTADGLVFLNHNGGQGSGVFDDTWGNSLSYSSADGATGSESSQILADALIADDVEIVIMSDTQCTGNDCGTVRPGTVAYHGFDGASKMFLIEFSMPLSGKTGFNADMPAAWMLNAQIPNTLQYGAADCSCWESGCGEFDIFEVLDSGNTRAKSTWHGNVSGGDSNFFARPTRSTMKAAVVLDGVSSAAYIIVLPADTEFSATISPEAINGYIDSIGQSLSSATFALSQ